MSTERDVGFMRVALEEAQHAAAEGEVPVGCVIVDDDTGEFALPPTRVEAMYAPEMFGETPNDKVKVEAAK